MKFVNLTVWIASFVLVVNIFIPFSCAEAIGDPQDNTGILASELPVKQPVGNQDTHTDTVERDNFDIASLLSLLGVGLLKFIDDKLKIKLKNKFKTYKKCLITATIFFGGLEAAIVICYFGKLGPASFGNLKNLFLGLIPFVFCILTLFTEKNESNPIILSQEKLEIRINDFTSSGMSPLGMIVGDMDFFGKVYNNSGSKKKRAKDDITTNSQIQALIDNNVDRIEIVCKIPTTNDAKRRIGYLLEEFEDRFQIRFFDEKKFPIPQMRGRIMYKQNEQVVVITKKIKKPSKYEYSEYAVSSLPGGLFADLWNTVWNCSADNPKIIENCKEAYINYVGKQRENV